MGEAHPEVAMEVVMVEVPAMESAMAQGWAAVVVTAEGWPTPPAKEKHPHCGSSAVR